MPTPIVTIAAFIPMVWLRWVSLTSPVNEMDRTANHSEKAGQSAKKAVSLRLKCGLRLSPAFCAELQNVLVGVRAGQRVKVVHEVEDSRGGENQDQDGKQQASNGKIT